MGLAALALIVAASQVMVKIVTIMYITSSIDMKENAIYV